MHKAEKCKDAEGKKNFETLVSLHFISNYAGNSFSFASLKLQLKSSCC